MPEPSGFQTLCQLHVASPVVMLITTCPITPDPVDRPESGDRVPLIIEVMVIWPNIAKGKSFPSRVREILNQMEDVQLNVTIAHSFQQPHLNQPTACTTSSSSPQFTGDVSLIENTNLLPFPSAGARARASSSVMGETGPGLSQLQAGIQCLNPAERRVAPVVAVWAWV